ncbi:unnamed protein product [Dibothriocephalus latus]|uniref:Mitochondrial import receptor subunit TOM20 homolog n=1 Tax=Dibothriocephalus latus TaxID=60516 RepID=A0A3P7LHZ1_DIBLA|nr:unnamed protein product [Dibothriocephalus latus]
MTLALPARTRWRTGKPDMWDMQLLEYKVATVVRLYMVATLVKYAIAGIGVGFLTYCVYFDRKRRSDPQFRIKLMQRRRERELSAKKQSMPALPPLNDPKAIHRFFLEQIQQGEVALSTGAIDEAVQSFALAVVVCGQPTQLLQVLQQSLSPPVFSKLVSALPAVRKMVLSTSLPTRGSTVEIEEELE